MRLLEYFQKIGIFVYPMSAFIFGFWFSWFGTSSFTSPLQTSARTMYSKVNNRRVLSQLRPFQRACFAPFVSNVKREILAAADLREPHNWFPEARSRLRKVVFHCGPTNSGKVTDFLLGTQFQICY